MTDASVYNRFHTVGAGHGKGKKLMLMVHGFPELWYSWRHQLEAFKHDYEVVSFDLRGYGLTEKPKVPLAPVSDPSPQLCLQAGICLTGKLDINACMGNESLGGYSVVYN